MQRKLGYVKFGTSPKDMLSTISLCRVAGPGRPSPTRSTGYIREMEQELRQLITAGDQEAVVRYVKEKCIESYRNGFDQGLESVS